MVLLADEIFGYSEFFVRTENGAEIFAAANESDPVDLTVEVGARRASALSSMT